MTPRLAASLAILGLILELMPAGAARAEAEPFLMAQAQSTQAQPAQASPAQARPAQPQPAARTVREKRADGVTVSIPPDLVRPAPGGSAMGYTDTTQGSGAAPGGWVEPAAMALGYVAPSTGARSAMPGPNAVAGPNA